MSFWYSDTSAERPTSIATGEASLSQILTAAREQTRLVENTTAAGDALARAYDDRLRDIEAATGETYRNPMRTELATGTFEQKPNPTYSFETGNESREAKMEAAVNGFNTWLADVARRHPDKAAAIRADQPVERDAEALARHADENLAKAMASREGAGKWAALFAGAVVGSGYDPVQVATLMAGGGPGAARSVGGRILAVTLKEAAVNGVIEAALQPQVQAWRKQVGLPNGLDEALKNVGFATLLGGAFGGMAQGGAEVVGRALRSADPEAVSRTLADAPTARPELRAAMDGDGRAAADLLAPIRADLPPEARGAVAAIEVDRMASDMRPPAATPARHDEALTAALRAAQSGEIFAHTPDPEQVRRLVDRLVPETATPAAGGELTISQFLTRSGGIRDFRGELAAIGADAVSERFVGRLVREAGMPLDDARRAAAEAGYFDRLYGTPDLAAEKSTVADLLDAIDDDMRARPERANEDGGRREAEALVHEIAARAGPAIDDELILKAAELSNAEGLAPAEALDRVLIADDLARAMSPEERLLKDNGYAIDAMGGVDLQRMLASISDEAEAMIYTVQDLSRLVQRRDALAALKATKAKGFDGSKILEASAPDGTYMGRGKLAVDMPAKGHEGYTVNERTDMLREMNAEIASLEELIAKDLPLRQNLDIVRQARSIRQPNPADTRGGLDDPSGFPPDDMLTAADLEDLPDDFDIPFFDDQAPISREALMEHLDNLDHLTAVVEACRA